MSDKPPEKSTAQLWDELEDLKRERMREEIRTTETRLQIEANFREHLTKVADCTSDSVRDLHHVVERFVETRAKIPDQVAAALLELDQMKTSMNAMAANIKALADAQAEVLSLKEQLVPKWLRNVLVAAGVAVLGAFPLVIGELLKYSHLSKHLDKLMPWFDKLATMDLQKLTDILEKLVK